MKEAGVIISIIVPRDFETVDIPQNLTLVHYIHYIMVIGSDGQEVISTCEALARDENEGVGSQLHKNSETHLSSEISRNSAA